MIKLKLKSDFNSYYDHAFDSDGFEFRRVTTDGPTRIEMFKYFQKLGFATPLFGTHSTFVNQGFLPKAKVVVHNDIKMHCGEGKELKEFCELDEQDKQCFLVQYIPNPENLFGNYKSRSTRFLFVGFRCFRMEYISNEDWRSNCGDGDIINFYEIDMPYWRNKVHYPLVAIDFVGDELDLKAIDFNVAPGVPSDIHSFVPASQFVLEIKKWFKGEFNG